MGNMILITHWLGGDVLPFIKMGKILKKNGHNVTLFSHCVYEKMAREHGLNFVSIDSPEEYSDMLGDFESFADPINNTKSTIAFHEKYHGKDHCLREVNLLCEHAFGKDTVIICRHRSSISGLIAAEKLKIPVISVFLAPNYIAHLQLHEQLIGNEIRAQINLVRTELGLKEIECWSDWMCSPKVIMGIWPEWFASDVAETIKSIQPIGFLNDDSILDSEFPENLNGFLEIYPHPVIISGGTSQYLSEKFYQAAVGACVEANLPAVCVCPHDELVPSNLPSNILRVGFIPLAKLMQRACAIIHHGGISTCGEAVNAGIPQLILAYLADRPDNGQRLQESGIAKWFPPQRWDAQLLGKALMDITEANFYNICKNKTEELKVKTSAQRLCEIVDTVSGNDEYNMPDSITPLFSVETAFTQEICANQKLEEKKQNLSEQKRQLLLKMLNGHI